MSRPGPGPPEPNLHRAAARRSLRPVPEAGWSTGGTISFARKARPTAAPSARLAPATVHERGCRAVESDSILDGPATTPRTLLPIGTTRRPLPALTNLVYAATQHAGDSERGIPARRACGVRRRTRGHRASGRQPHRALTIPRRNVVPVGFARLGCGAPTSSLRQPCRTRRRVAPVSPDLCVPTSFRVPLVICR